jgi:8-oxo-dGTP pyrophosphatase MutT (NUDIX family)
MLPGETAGEAAAREAAEETGIDATVTRELSARVHPGTAACIIYVACRLASGTARAASAREVAEVRWASPREADDLTGGRIYQPVRRHLHEAAAGSCN